MHADCVARRLLGEEPPCSLWDVLKILNERDDDHRIYLHLTAQLEAAFYKSTG
jgi:hypothetical protein